ncbi:HAMP domain-containing histidine kinase [Vagococcus sp. BWB3-3]|uniref:histidine kinase n=1 Tax=Vagococcus allomyrinae TaxID=2794353 RepID=A0A940PDF6_9ENTE|nr:HAMP domain-containing sensor histidine kinase [Vagococcus allomyrinae]MBP1041481.1 HAMP domain-containing histidine kinase [Vagococcus allomyrinae]
MTIRKRLFFYSFGVVGLAALLILLYFMLMLSQLYAKQIETDRVNTLKSIQVLQLSGDDQQISQALNQFETPNSIASMTLIEGSSKIVINLAYSTIELDVTDPDLQGLVKELYDLIADIQNLTEKELDAQVADLIERGKALLTQKELLQKWDSDLITLKVKDTNQNYQEVFQVEGGANVHRVTDQQFIVEAKVSDNHNRYSTYLGLTSEQKKLHLVMAAAMTPKMTQLNQVIYGSLPMIVTVLLVIISLATGILAYLLIRPLKKVSNLMEDMKKGRYELTEVSEGVRDEYQQLEADLVALYATLEHQKSQLATQNQRQGVFLKASSHQLKTPVTGALLLVEGMIGEVGKYRETARYLPEVKETLRSMEQIINEILLIDQRVKAEPQLVSVTLAAMVQPLIAQQAVLFEKKSLELKSDIDPEMLINTDPIYFEQIVENLLSNACNYTDSQQKIRIYTKASKLIIENDGCQLDETWLEKLFEPFVRPPQKRKGHGLGLYLVAQYAELLGLRVTLANSNRNSVVATIHF